MADLIGHGARAFERAGLAFGHGTDNAIDEAAALVFHALGLDHAEAESAYVPAAACGAQVERVLALFAERIERRVPAAYLMGRMWFAGLEFEVDDRVIVPRSPFAELIRAGFEPWIDPARVAAHPRHRHRLGLHRDRLRPGFSAGRASTRWTSRPTRSRWPGATCARHAVGDRVRLLQGDVFEAGGRRRYDLIVANPPYVSDAEMAALPREYRPRARPRAARRRRTVSTSCGASWRTRRGTSTPDGALFVEVGDSEPRVAEAFPRLPFVWLEFEHGGGGVFLLRRADFKD